MLEVVCGLLPNLEELQLEGDFDNLNSELLALHKLKKLKKFSAGYHTENKCLGRPHICCQ